MPNTAEHAIVVDQLSKRYGKLLAVDNVSFTVNKGELFAFLGPNGAGKSTTVEIIETIRAPTSGKVTVLGMDAATHKRDIVRRIGVLPQEFGSYDRITVAETIRYYSRLFGQSDANIDALMDVTNLRSKRDALFKTLSGGLKQRLGIAIALVNDPEVVFLDEPTTGLDPRARREVWDVLKGLKSRGKTVFLTTHYMEEAELLADTVAIISKGRIVAAGSPNDLIEKNTEHMSLTLKGVDDRAFALMQKNGFNAERSDEKNIRVPVKDARDVSAILDALEKAGVETQGIDVRKPSLETVFLKITGETLDEADAPGGERP